LTEPMPRLRSCGRYDALAVLADMGNVAVRCVPGPVAGATREPEGLRGGGTIR
jgi:hypothetical protein